MSLTKLSTELIKHKPASTDSVERVLKDKLGEFVSVKDFGAKGDGVTDDTAAIQAAINSVGPNSTVQYPAGSYKVTSSIQLQLQQSHIGFGAKIIASNGITVFSKNGSDGFPGRISFQNLVITGTANTGKGIAISNNTPFITINNCLISGFDEGVRLTDSYSSCVKDSYIVGNNHGLLLVGECHASTVINVLMDSNVYTQMGINGSSIHGNLSSNPMHNISIIGGGMQRGRYGLWAENCYELSITNMYHEGNTYADLQLGVADSGTYSRACYNFSINGWQSSSPCGSGTNIVIQHAVNGNLVGLAFNSGTPTASALVAVDGYSDLICLDYHRVQTIAAFTDTVPFTVPASRVIISNNGRRLVPWGMHATRYGTPGTTLGDIYGGYTSNGRPIMTIEAIGSGVDLGFKVNDIERHLNAAGVEKLNIDHLNGQVTSAYPVQPMTNYGAALGSQANRWAGIYGQNISLIPPASIVPSSNGEMTFQLTSNTSLTIKVKGSDGVVRSTNLTLT
jgi:hypothetical protein